MGKAKEFIKFVSEIYGIGSKIWPFASSFVTGGWALVSGWHPVLIILVVLATSTLVLAATAFMRFHNAFDWEYLFEKIDPELPGVKWNIRVWKQWEKDPESSLAGKRVIGNCSSCNIGLYVDKRTSDKCRECGNPIGTYEKFEMVKHHITNEAKSRWESGRKGFSRAMKSSRVDGESK